LKLNELCRFAREHAADALAAIDDTSERGWAAEWISAILGRERVEVTPEAKDHVWSALTSLASAPIQERTLTGLCVLLQSNALKRALQPYCLGGPYGRLLDAEFERLGEGSVKPGPSLGLLQRRPAITRGLISGEN
jgi:type IV secretion system protein TrbE